MAFPAQNVAYAGNALLAYARKALFRGLLLIFVGRNKTI